MPKLTHNSTTTAIRVLGLHVYVHERHVVALFIRKLIHSYVNSVGFQHFFVCFLFTYDTLTCLVAWWSELLTTNHEVPGMILGSTMCVFP